MCVCELVCVLCLMILCVCIVFNDCIVLIIGCTEGGSPATRPGCSTAPEIPDRRCLKCPGRPAVTCHAFACACAVDRCVRSDGPSPMPPNTRSHIGRLQQAFAAIHDLQPPGAITSTSFWTIYHTLLSSTSPNTHRVLYSTSCLY